MSMFHHYPLYWDGLVLIGEGLQSPAKHGFNDSPMSLLFIEGSLGCWSYFRNMLLHLQYKPYIKCQGSSGIRQGNERGNAHAAYRVPQTHWFQNRRMISNSDTEFYPEIRYDLHSKLQSPDVFKPSVYANPNSPLYQKIPHCRSFAWWETPSWTGIGKCIILFLFQLWLTLVPQKM